MIVNLKLQSQLVHVLFSHIKAFEEKLEFFKKQLSHPNLSRFPVLEQLNCNDYAPTFVKCISQLQKKSEEQFKDFRSREQEMIFVTQPFSAEAGDAATELQMELLFFVTWQSTYDPGQTQQKDGDRRLILLPPQPAVLPRSNAGSDGVEPEPGVVIQNCQAHYSWRCPMYGTC